MSKKEIIWYLIGITLLAASIIIIEASEGKKDKSSSGPDDYRIDAMIVCKKFVKARLKTPATADFSNASTSNVGYGYTVTGVVDSQNSFGANVRSNYECKMRVVGDTWNLNDIKIDKR